MGDLAAGIALALNNELNALGLALQLLRGELHLPLDERARRHLEQIDAALARSAALVVRLQELGARKTQGAPRAIDLNAAVLEALDLVRPELTAAATERAVRVDARLGSLKPVMAPGAELRDVLCKLLVAARDELPRGGTLRIVTRAAPAPDDGRGELELAYAGTGQQPADDVRLTLEAAREMIHKWDGQLTESDRGDERRLTLNLPLAAEEAKPAAPDLRARVRTARRVLVVDDDAGNRETLTELLALSGHEVEDAATSEEALRLAGRRPFDAALVDLAMPGMNGLELARRLRVDHPDLRIALVTGWEPSATGAHEEPGLVDALFRKPIDLSAIQSFLDGGDLRHREGVLQST
jgi:CheY-like chemotaxis protein